LFSRIHLPPGIASTESIGRQGQQFRGGVQIGLGPQEVDMPEVHREQRETAAKIHPLAVPAREAVNGKGVAEVIWARTNTTLAGLQATDAIQLAERLACRYHREETKIRPDE
jgi:hypothetical protein